MMRGIVWTLAVLLVVGCLLLTGCGLLNREQVDAVHAVVLAKLDEAWAEKGAEAVEAKVAELVAAGKITPAQGDALNAAAKQGYEVLRAKAEKIMAGGLEKSPE